MINRRKFLKLSASSAAVGPLLIETKAKADPLALGGKDYSSLSGTEHEAIATACGLCASRCPAIGYLDNDYLVKIEGQPESARTMGRFCARGQAGVNQAYDPDRIMQPMKRVGKRGEGNWQQISWDQALSELSERLSKLRKEGQPEKFMFHHGEISASADRLINKVFLPSYGTGTVANDSCLDQSARLIAHQLTWGTQYDSWDFGKSNFVLNFGSNVLEADANFVALARRLSYALTDRNFSMVTFDVRLSNTAAKSESWVRLNPGTDAAVILAMCHVVMEQELYQGKGEEFLAFCRVTDDHEATIDEKITALKLHLADYTPKWAEEISGVNAQQIEDIAIQFANQTSCLISGRGVSGHQNGVETERAIQMLAAITGNLEIPGTRCRGVRPNWHYPRGPKDKPQVKQLDIVNGIEGQVALPINTVGNQVLNQIKEGKAGRPDVYMWYNYNPVLANGDVQQNLDILVDDSLIPFTVAVSSFYDESAAVADLILPDATYLEMYDFEEGISPTQTAEFTIRQPVIKPQGQVRDFKDVCCELATKMGFPLGFDSAKEFVEQACELTPEMENIGGFETMEQIGVWSDPKAEPSYSTYQQKVSVEELENLILDKNTGVYWDWTKSHAINEAQAVTQGYEKTKDAFKGYRAQKIGELAYKGFDPQALNTSGYFELYSSLLGSKGFSPLPTFMPISSHENKQADELILTTYQLNVQTPFKSQNCRWLDEISDENPAWINLVTAEERQIKDGDKIIIRTRQGEIETKAKVTQLIMPGVIAIDSHGHHWEFGRYASGKNAPFSAKEDRYEVAKWWQHQGKHPNWIISNVSEPISGQQCWKDTVVTVNKA